MIRNRKCSKLTLLGITDAFNWDRIVIAVFLWKLIDTPLELIRINTVNYLPYTTVWSDWQWPCTTPQFVFLMQIIKDDIFILITQWIIRIKNLFYWPRAMRTIGFCVCKRTHIEIIGLAKMNNELKYEIPQPS